MTAPLAHRKPVEPEPPPKKKGKVRAPPRVAALPTKAKGGETNDDDGGTTSPRLEWEQQQRLLDKLEAEQRRKEEIEWRQQLAVRVT